MGTNFRATTALVSSDFTVQGGQLFDGELPEKKLNLEVFRSLPPFQKALICSSVSMRSRGAWAMEMLQRVCKIAKLEELSFLGGSSDSSLVSAIRILEADEDEPEQTYVAKLGFLLDEAAMKRTTESIGRLFEWSLSNLDKLAAPNLMGDYAFKNDIEHAIKNPVVFEKWEQESEGRFRIVSNVPNIKGYEDGDGPWYFYSWLRSIQQIIRAALILRQSVFHVVDNFD